MDHGSTRVLKIFAEIKEEHGSTVIPIAGSRNLKFHVEHRLVRRSTIEPLSLTLAPNKHGSTTAPRIHAEPESTNSTELHGRISSSKFHERTGDTGSEGR